MLQTQPVWWVCSQSAVGCSRNSIKGGWMLMFGFLYFVLFLYFVFFLFFLLFALCCYPLVALCLLLQVFWKFELFGSATKLTVRRMQPLVASILRKGLGWNLYIYRIYGPLFWTPFWESTLFQRLLTLSCLWIRLHDSPRSWAKLLVSISWGGGHHWLHFGPVESQRRGAFGALQRSCLSSQQAKFLPFSLQEKT